MRCGPQRTQGLCIQVPRPQRSALNGLSLSPPPATPRSASPKHGFTIMNRLSMENRTEPITKDLDFLLQDPFLLYRNARCESDRVFETV